ncbi:hypothetical protein PSTT_06823 [Puccinia striiformis]|uniref:Uncharacterized protein n=2 Tax=Puccinia striiformis TaxID=27350 RepID=A0A0L0VSV2_9BASI|nr:hypothetical protein PSTG_04573 [Puccinia striiformis f. sp. tritici PST-78]POW09413.1 hypothetical protein PSTT_06823 [Puccinia striiformis]
MAGQPGIHFKNTIVAHKLFDTFNCSKSRDQVGALWDTKPDKEKKCYRNPAFLITLRPMTCKS